MTAPIVQIVWLNRRPFLSVMCLTFLAFAYVIFMMPKLATVRMALDIGSAIIGEKQEPFEPPEQVARRIFTIYAPAALLAMESKGTSPWILSALQDPLIESIGRSLVVVSIVPSDAKNEAKEFQETTADHILKALANRSRALRENVAARIALATATSDVLDQQIKATAEEIERISALIDELRSQLENRRANLAAEYQHTGTPVQPVESAIIEAHIRELHEQTSSQTASIGSLTLERTQLTNELAATRRLKQAQSKAIADAQYEQNSFSETHLLLPPSLMPARTTSSRLSLLLVALVISVLAGFGTVVLLHNVVARKIER